MALFVVSLLLLGTVYGASLDTGDDHCVTNLDDIDVMDNFDYHKFAGVWYTHSNTHYIFTEDRWDSMTHVLYPHYDGSVTAVKSGHEEGRDDCFQEVLVLNATGPARYEGVFKGHKKYFKILWTDYNIAAIFRCFHVNDDGTCSHENDQIELWSHVPDDLTDDQKAELLSHVGKIDCTDVNDLVYMKHGACDAASSWEPQHAPGECLNSPYNKETLSTPKPTGIWETLIEAVPVGEKPHPTSYKFIPATDAEVVYKATSEPSGDECTPVDVEKYYRLSDEHYFRKGKYHTEEFWAHPLPSGDKELFLCHERSVGNCTKSEIMLLTQHHRPVTFEALEAFHNKHGSTYCQKYDDYVDQSVGKCSVPDFLGYLLSYSDIEHHYTEYQTETKSMKVEACKLTDIPVKENFQLSELTGVWYEIARPKNIMNQYDSSVAYFSLDDHGELHSFYSGAIDGHCKPAIETDKHRLPSGHGGQLESRLHGPEGMFPWLPYDIVYSDGTYSLHYDCHKTDDHGNCVDAEASIYGRQPYIDDYTRHKLYDMFPSLCLSTEYLQYTEHHVDCSEWVRPHTDEDQHCLVHEIPVQHDVSLERMEGVWYIVEARNDEADQLYIHRENEQFVVDEIGTKDGHCTTIHTESIEQSADGSGDLLIAEKHGNVRPLYSLKIIYTDYQVGIVYECLQENIHGECTPEGTKILIISRDDTIDPLRLVQLEAQLKLPCEDLHYLETVTGHCPTERHCMSLDVHGVEHFDARAASGVWYDVYKPVDITYGSDLFAHSGVFNMSVDSHGDMQWKFSEFMEHGKCHDLLTSSMRMRGHDGAADFLTTPLESTRTWGFYPLSIVHADYDDVMVIYVCLYTQFDGECKDDAKRMRIVSRHKTLDSEVRANLMHYFEEACVDDHAMNVDCSHLLM